VRPLSGKEFCKLLEAHAWELARIRGSHHVYRKEGRSERLSVPVHGSEPLKKGLQAHLMKVAGIDPGDV
jgi:predicted RNA binding protein YcfA (HicA-like mRNA interferase family)